MNAALIPNPGRRQFLKAAGSSCLWLAGGGLSLLRPRSARAGELTQGYQAGKGAR
jgi:hypothetical protein